MQGANREAMRLERLVDDRDIALAIAEDDRILQAFSTAQQAPERLTLGRAATVRGDEALRDGRGGRCGFRHFDAGWIVEELFGQAGDFRRHGGREEQRLAREGHELADALDVRNEAHVEHAVGLVDDENLDARQQQLAALGEVEQASRRRDQHVGTAHDLGFLVREGHAADQQGDVDLVVGPIFHEAFLDLRCKFARWFEDQRARHARAGAPTLKPGQHGQCEGRRLAGAGLGDTEHVAPGKGVRDGFRLDGCGGCVAGGRNCLQDLLAQAEFVECHS